MGKKFNEKVFIIAEAGVNHNGDIKIARRMIDVAKGCGADAVKFQTFIPEEVMIPSVPKADYQIELALNRETQLEMLKKLQLDLGAHKRLMDYCEKRKVIFISSPFDLKSVDLLYRLGVKIFKVPSGEITNLPYLRKIGALRRKVIISTGMADLKEIRRALDILVMAGTPKEAITVMHCNSAYPTPFEDVNLSAMLTIRNTFAVSVGYSDHTLGIEVPIAAAALGATVIEKHFTLNRNMPGPDQRASLEPEELRMMVSAIRNIEKAMGNGLKRPSPSEARNKTVARKGIVASRDIRKGEAFSEDNLAVKRPEKGISPMRWDAVLGRKAKRDFKKNEFISL